MAKITKIEEQKNKKRVNIFVDNAFFCGLNKEKAISFGFKVGVDVDESKLKSAVFESEVQSAFEKACDYISMRSHSKFELKRKLLLKGFESEVVLKAIAKLEEYGYISDEVFANEFVKSSGNLSKKMIEFKLKEKGIDKGIIERTTALVGRDLELESCEKETKKYLSGKNPADKNLRQKLFASLARKGFDFDTIKAATKKLLCGADDDDIDFD